MADIREVIARLQNGSLLICEGLDGHDGCGGQGYTDGGATCCAFCLGTGLATPELAAAVRDEKKFRNFTVEFIGLVDDIWEDDDVDLPALRGLADTARARLRSLFDEPASTRKAAALSTAPAARPGDEVDHEITRILAMSDADVIAEIEAEGRDPKALAEAMRGQMGATFKLCEEIKTLREALAPFAAILANGEPVGPIPRGLLDSKLTRQDLRRATAAYRAASAVEGETP